ncbi:hypothetical protein EDB81DRAFT_846945 [Dactylonectria macrodidyma]|uniref:Xylanolytic transcriptional activator regulatory domain-containing protein n=1 Tax=Dactylonectria macrodidyma TaxID=307937 RepID=A0A9P9DRQ4_9HYPO|nr:hypothetical protein EDB81DRAFT_846945 [Dactylonectria macrodidyma]
MQEPAPSREPTPNLVGAASRWSPHEAIAAQHLSESESLPLGSRVCDNCICLGKFLDIVHDAVPIFSRARFLPGLTDSRYSRDLILTLVLITAKLTEFTFSSQSFDLDTRIDLMLSSGWSQVDIYSNCPSLDQFRKACLLAFYEFHQFPGQQAWMRIGKLTRMAQWIGIDRLELLHAYGPSWGAMSQDDFEDWRLVWWFVYRLDSYANLSTGTPYLIDEKLVRTALLSDRPLDCLSESPQHQNLYLPPRPDDLWELVLAMSSCSRQTSLFNLHIITATAMRQVGRVFQLYMLRLMGEKIAPPMDIERCLSVLRLSLPTNHLNPTRNAFLNETRSDHHARLVTVLHLHMARLLVSIIGCCHMDEGIEWLQSWQQVLEICQDIVSVSEQWNGTFSLSVDPAISFIIFTTLIFVDLHKKFAGVSVSHLQSNLEHSETALLLLLEQFARRWTLPRLLILSFKSFRELLSGPLLYSHIQSMLSRFEAPLHPRWLQFLSSAQANLETRNETRK